jgi:hypothetical protein
VGKKQQQANTMIKNGSGQSIGAQMTTAADGTDFTSTVTVYVTGDNGTQTLGSVGSGVCTHEGNGYHSYAPAQAETNYDHIAFTFIGTGAISSTLQLYTSYPQTGDSYARLGAPAGASVSADIADVPTVGEFNARTLLAADYFDPAADTVANVTTVGTCTTNTDMRGTDSAALASNYTATRAGYLDNINNSALQTTTAQTGDSYAYILANQANWLTATGFSTHSAGDVMTTVMTESYSTDGAAATPAQALYLTMQALTEFSISSTTTTIKKLDGSTTAATLTHDDATNATNATRAS